MVINILNRKTEIKRFTGIRLYRLYRYKKKVSLVRWHMQKDRQKTQNEIKNVLTLRRIEEIEK